VGALKLNACVKDSELAPTDTANDCMPFTPLDILVIILLSLAQKDLSFAERPKFEDADISMLPKLKPVKVINDDPEDGPLLKPPALLATASTRWLPPEGRENQILSL
jgi:hypothetical protein